MIRDEKIISYFTVKSDGNMSFSRDPSREAVQQNFRSAAEKLGLSYDAMVCGQQTHGTEVGLVTGETAGSGISRPLYFDGTDALITDLPGTALCTIHADCIPVQFWDPVHQAVGAAHSGWRGTLGEIAARVTEKMAEAFGSVPRDLIAAIGPGICRDCFEVGPDVQTAFQDRFPALCEQTVFLREGRRDGKWNLNLKAFVYRSLINSGLTPDHITVSPACTCCCEDLYFSHRRDSKRPVAQGAMASVIALR